MSRANLSAKVLDFVQLGGPKMTESSSTIKLVVVLLALKLSG